MSATEWLLLVIANPENKRAEVAAHYGVALREGESVEWRFVNEAILERWSMAGLRWIKERAWKEARA